MLFLGLPDRGTRLEYHIRDCDKRIARGHNRLKLAHDEQNGADEDERVKVLTERINEMMDQAEELGCQGKVDEAQGMTRLCEQLKMEKQQLASELSGVPSVVYSSIKGLFLHQADDVRCTLIRKEEKRVQATP
jgi:predicted  nucleic acid-binding Zn-ribbon protein